MYNHESGILRASWLAWLLSEGLGLGMSTGPVALRCPSKPQSTLAYWTLPAYAGGGGGGGLSSTPLVQGYLGSFSHITDQTKNIHCQPETLAMSLGEKNNLLSNCNSASCAHQNITLCTCFIYINLHTAWPTISEHKNKLLTSSAGAIRPTWVICYFLWF